MNSLAHWCDDQRALRRRNTLRRDREKRLNTLGFPWNPLDARWENMWQRLKEYKKECGNCRIPRARERRKRYQGLRRWVQFQRELKRQKKLDTQRAKQLDSLDFEWDLSDVNWEDKYSDLLSYQEKHGRGSYPLNGSRETALVAWLGKQRNKYRKGTLDRRYIRRLEERGMDWSPHASKYQEMLRELKRFRKRHGHCNIHRSDQKNQALGRYVAYLRALKKKGQLAPGKVAHLEKVGVRWDATQAYYDGMWDRMLEKLAAYKRANGHCDVSTRWSGGRQLGEWLGKQRKRKEEGTLSAAQERALETLGITWRIHHKAWDQHYRALCRFSQIHGHCRVTQRSRAVPGLYRWVCAQRHLRTIGRLADERVTRLKKLGFQWTGDGGKR